MLADTAIVANNLFFHYCHRGKGLMALRTHRYNCPLCGQKNPDYLSNKLAHTVTDVKTGSVVMVFADIENAIQYIQEHSSEILLLGDTGYVD